MSNYIETMSGRKIDFFDPDPEQIVIEDIVTALMNTCRFGGHTHRFYSVMAHSENVSLLVPDSLKYEAIMHDAAEAYIGDMPTPFKYALPDFLQLERRIQEAINIKFSLPPVMSEIIKNADRVALMTERDYLKPSGLKWDDKYENTPRVPHSTFSWVNSTKSQYLGAIEYFKGMRDA